MHLLNSTVLVLDPLERSLLQKITASPGINRKGLHKALGGHVQAEAMVAVLGKLNAQGKVRSETVSTGGRPSECWWPTSLPENTTMIIASASPSDAVLPIDVSVPTKKDEQQPAAPATDSSNPPGQVEETTTDSSLTGDLPVDAEVEPLSLGELFCLVRDMGGKIVRSKDGGFAVQGVEKPRLTPAILTALEAHHCELDLIVPSPAPPPPVESGDAVVGSSDEYCHPCFLAEIQSLSPEPE